MHHILFDKDSSPFPHSLYFHEELKPVSSHIISSEEDSIPLFRHDILFEKDSNPFSSIILEGLQPVSSRSVYYLRRNPTRFPTSCIFFSKTRAERASQRITVDFFFLPRCTPCSSEEITRLSLRWRAGSEDRELILPE